MDVTFTNVLEGARQYFQGLPINASSASNSAYQNPPEPQQRNNNEPKRNQEHQQSPKPYWMGQQEQHCLPSRESTPNQRPPSYNSDSSRPPSHPLYINTSQEQRTANYPSNYQEQTSSYPMHIMNQQQQLQQHQQFSHQQIHLQPHSPRTQPPKQQFNHHGQQVHYQQPAQQQSSQQPTAADFQFTKPHHRDAPSNTSNYPSHILQNTAYHHPATSTHNSMLSSSSPKPSRKLEQSKVPHPTNYTPQTTSSTQTSSGYVNYQQSRSFYPANSYANHQSSSDNKSYNTPQAYPYQQSSQMSNSNYYKNVYQPHSSSPSMYSSSSTSTHSSKPDQQQLNANYNNQSSRTHNLPPIAQFSESYFKSVRDNQKLNSGRSQSNSSNTASVVKNMNSQAAMPVNQNYKMDYQYDQRAVNQQYVPSSTAATATSSSFNSVTSRSTGTYSVQSLTSANNQFTSKSSQNISNSSYNTASQMKRPVGVPSCEDQRRNSTGNKQKRESPLDLSVKTVRTPADSTLDDHESDRSNYLVSSRVPPIPAHFPTFDPYSGSYQRNTNAQRVPQTNTVSTPKVDYIPNYGMLGSTQQNYRQDQRPFDVSRNQRVPNERRSTLPKETPGRYPVTSAPNTVNSFPKLDNPTVGHSLKSSAVYPTHMLDTQRKRPADTAPPIDPKIPKTESWRQTIDRQIEQKLSTYKQDKEDQKSKEPYINTSKESLINGNCNTNRSKEAYSNNFSSTQYHAGLPTQQPFNISQYNSYPNHTQTYVPSPGSQYNSASNYSSHYQNMYSSRELVRSNSNSSLSSVKSNTGGAADKRVLTLLRNSIETKGVKEAQRKYGQEQFSKYTAQPHHRSDVQQPSTHVTAPLQPRPAFMGRQNVSPFTPNSLPEGNNTTPLFNKLHVPRAIDSINFDMNKSMGNVANKQLEAVINDQNNPNGDLDGLAAFLAARIRTKAELKQVSPTQQVNNNGNNVVQNVENQIRSTLKQENFSSNTSTISSNAMNVPKLANQPSQQPRKRLFSRSEDDNGNASTKDMPARDKSGLRSSSETSVFDFPDSGSEGEMPVEMQSLTAMRKDRKLSLKQTSNSEIKEVKPELSLRPLTPEDDIFLQACDTFMDQLKAGIGKKRGRRKKTLEPDVLAKLESVTKENPIDIEIKIKEERPDDSAESIIDVKDQDVDSSILFAIPNHEGESKNVSKQIIEELSLSVVKKELPDDLEEQNKEVVEEVDKVQQDELSDSDGETIKQLSNKLKNKSVDPDLANQPSELQVLVTKPTKKPPFGDGSAFYPGWEEEVYKYKKSLRMPPSLIQVRPPSSMRISTSLPDLDPCHSPSSTTLPERDEDSKSIYSKVKSEPFDSDIESNSSFNLFNSKNNYDSEGGSSIRSLPTPVKDSIVDKLLQKCGKKKKRKYKKKEEVGPKIIPKAENPVELLPTPSLEIKVDNKKQPVIKTEAPILGFRKSTIENFKDAFLNRASNIVGMNEQFSTVILKSRTRKETRVLKQRATIKEVFGEDRPASAPPLSCINVDLKDIKKEVEDQEQDEEPVKKVKEGSIHSLKNKLLGRGKSKNNLLKSIADKRLRSEVLEELSADKEVKTESRDQSPSVLSEDLDSKSETVSLDGEENVISVKKRGKMNKIRRKCSSGFDYIRKKKKQVKKDSDQNEPSTKKKKREPVLKASPESEQDIQKEIKSWVLNKGVGETHLHRSARLGYTDVTAYCLEKMECSPSPRDNAGYTPLHEACSRGHLDIARLLLMYGANVSESAKGGIRPLHEAVENGFVEIIRLLLSYGADPKLATYAGLTPLSLASDETTKTLLVNHMDDLEGKSIIPWPFYGPATCFDSKDTGCDIFSSPPHPEPLSEEEDIEFEVSEFLLPNLYTLRGEIQGERWILLQDLSNILKIKSRDALLKQICPTPPPGTSPNYKSILRELKTSDFMEQAHCCQFLNASEKINLRASKIALVKYTDKIRELLKIEEVVITAR
ncbi:uncharacterized protein LOC123316165 [Coccinella septempunctata]|uniref:uncharacterized protein LOC123316165 n=1 Tax=Coccinella septempunctata TaxID=41139 RepID=UPI001D084B78|nr:uncharacterized protein LOC123316165 [Coccinella septempunctata]XP_044758093.1 uncharacterized protein LOC123316165 [Coccinella septempunctata]XP_044758094.1 uncharacterized protein LOC123316165 [Coccinella septempunctata]